MSNPSSWSIGTFARKLGISRRMLRYLEKYGLVQPSRRGKYRCYSPLNVCQVASTQMYQQLGFTLREIKQLNQLETAEAMHQAEALVAKRIQQDQVELTKIQQRAHRLERLRGLLLRQQKPHQRCLLCLQPNDGSMTFWAGGVDLMCEACLRRSASTSSTVAVDKFCTLCGSSGQDRPLYCGSDGNICAVCSTDYVEQL